MDYPSYKLCKKNVPNKLYNLKEKNYQKWALILIMPLTKKNKNITAKYHLMINLTWMQNNKK